MRGTSKGSRVGQKRREGGTERDNCKEGEGRAEEEGGREGGWERGRAGEWEALGGS